MHEFVVTLRFYKFPEEDTRMKSVERHDVQLFVPTEVSIQKRESYINRQFRDCPNVFPQVQYQRFLRVHHFSYL